MNFITLSKLSSLMVLRACWPAMMSLVVILVSTRDANAQEIVDPKSSDPLVNAAIEARKKSRAAIDEFNRPKNAEKKNPFRKETTQQIRNQIELVGELNATMQKTRMDRQARIGKMRTEVELLLLEIKKLNDAKVAPRNNAVTSQASNQKPIETNSVNPSLNQSSPSSLTQNQMSANQLTDKGTASNNPSANPNTKSTNVNGQSSTVEINADSTGKSKNVGISQGEPQQFRALAKDPVNKLGLANNLVAIGSYKTAIEIFNELLKDKSIDGATRNWIRYQLGRCFRQTQSFPEAEMHLREAANSKTVDIARETSIWWLDQLAGQKQLEASLSQMQEQLENLGASYDSGN